MNNQFETLFQTYDLYQESPLFQSTLDYGEPQEHLIAQCSSADMAHYQRDSQLLHPMDLADTWEEVCCKFLLSRTLYGTEILTLGSHHAWLDSLPVDQPLSPAAARESQDFQRRIDQGLRIMWVTEGRLSNILRNIQRKIAWYRYNQRLAPVAALHFKCLGESYPINWRFDEDIFDDPSFVRYPYGEVLEVDVRWPCLYLATEYTVP